MTAPTDERRAAALRAATKPAPKCLAAPDFAASMRKLASGVVVVTTEVDGQPWGVTLSSVSSFSADPARISLSIKKTTATGAYIAEHEQFGVAILPHAMADLANALAAPGSPKFIPEEHLGEPSPTLTLPVIEGAIYNLECTVAYVVEAIDHLLVIADVVSACAGEHADTVSPLTFFDRTFGSFAAGNSER
ncbi:flavin reductase family protein [Rhodococcus sp. D-6]|uniref:Flavin reductase family protein n=1 Tax=Rhodococcus sp. D-6 TaxID=1387842 RepID=A0AAU7UUG4_9NOCA|nr:flavin reductase family protein [Rhodococcus sp. HS-D2]